MRWVVLVCFGCGRSGFDTADSGTTRPLVDAAVSDSLIDSQQAAVTVQFGERTDLTFQNVTADTFISNELGEPALNSGATEILRSEQDVDERILVRFDLSALPITATVLDAILTVEITNANSLATMTVHPLLEGWTEGTADGTAGVANFLERTATAVWSTPGAGSPNSSGASFGSFVPAANGPAAIVLAAGVVQGWVTDPTTNHGMIVMNSHTNSVRIAAREHSTAAFRPMLQVTYRP